MPCCCCWFFFFFSFYNRISLDFFFDILQLILLYNKPTQGNSLLQVEQWDSISCTTKILFSRKNLMCTYRMCSQLSTPSGSPSATKNKKKKLLPLRSHLLRTGHTSWPSKTGIWRSSHLSSTLNNLDGQNSLESFTFGWQRFCQTFIEV